MLLCQQPAPRIENTKIWYVFVINDGTAGHVYITQLVDVYLRLRLAGIISHVMHALQCKVSLYRYTSTDLSGSIARGAHQPIRKCISPLGTLLLLGKHARTLSKHACALSKHACVLSKI